MAKRTMRLTENDLHNLIMESVNNVLNEGFGDRLQGAARGFKQGAADMHNQELALKDADDWMRSQIEYIIRYLAQCQSTGKTPNCNWLISELKTLYNNRRTRQGDAIEQN